MLVVVKFGGTSVGSAERIRGAAAILHGLRAQGHQVVAVTSAMSGVTDRLVGLSGRMSLLGEDEATFLGQSLIDTKALEDSHLATVQEAIEDPGLRDEVASQVSQERHNLDRLLFGSYLLGELSPIGYDFLVSTGERLVVPILAACVRQLGSPAVGLGGDEAGIRLNSNYGSAVPDMERTREHVRKALLPLLEAGKIPVVTGFYGLSDQNRVAILGRGGSDYSATLIGAALDADEIWIMTDVDGIKTTDPRLVKSAFTRREMSYRMAGELAMLGAKVLHPRSVEPAARQRIPLRIASSFEPEKPGTYLVAEPAEQPTVAALTLVRRGGLVRLRAEDSPRGEALSARFTDEVRRRNIEVLARAASLNGASLLWLVPPTDLKAFLALWQQQDAAGCEVEVRENVAALGIVGNGVACAPGVLSEVVRCLEEVDSTPMALLQGISPDSMVIALADEQEKLARALGTLHARLGLDDTGNPL